MFVVYIPFIYILSVLRLGVYLLYGYWPTALSIVHSFNLIISVVFDLEFLLLVGWLIILFLFFLFLNLFYLFFFVRHIIFLRRWLFLNFILRHLHAFLFLFQASYWFVLYKTAAISKFRFYKISKILISGNFDFLFQVTWWFVHYKTAISKLRILIIFQKFIFREFRFFQISWLVHYKIAISKFRMYFFVENFDFSGNIFFIRWFAELTGAVVRILIRAVSALAIRSWRGLSAVGGSGSAQCKKLTSVSGVDRVRLYGHIQIPCLNTAGYPVKLNFSIGLRRSEPAQQALLGAGSGLPNQFIQKLQNKCITKWSDYIILSDLMFFFFKELFHTYILKKAIDEVKYLLCQTSYIVLLTFQSQTIFVWAQKQQSNCTCWQVSHFTRQLDRPALSSCSMRSTHAWTPWRAASFAGCPGLWTLF